jgi:hypothetical protein
MGGITARRVASIRAIQASVKLSSPSRSGCRVARVAGVEAERELGVLDQVDLQRRLAQAWLPADHQGPALTGPNRL